DPGPRRHLRLRRHAGRFRAAVAACVGARAGATRLRGHRRGPADLRRARVPAHPCPLRRPRRAAIRGGAVAPVHRRAVPAPRRRARALSRRRRGGEGVAASRRGGLRRLLERPGAAGADAAASRARRAVRGHRGRRRGGARQAGARHVPRRRRADGPRALRLRGRGGQRPGSAGGAGGGNDGRGRRPRRARARRALRRPPGGFRALGRRAHGARM
ncbi:MAG: hypothetical protein AVDCRST_MAG69-1708, partial [uncultured Solirubrobacteraceae bacterium]